MRKEPPTSAVDALYGQALPNENGVDLYVECSASGAPLTLCGSYACSNREGIIQYTYHGLWRAKTTSAPAATVRDAAGNSSTCTVTIYSKTQNRSATCSSCKSCSSAGCAQYKYCANSACGCKTEKWSTTYQCPGGRNITRSFSSKTACQSFNPTCSNGVALYPDSCSYSCIEYKSCRTSGCGCDSYYSSCASCGCNSLGSYSGWYDGSTTAGWHGSYHYQIRTVYY